MVDQGPNREEGDAGSRVWWDPAHFTPADIEAVLPDGSRAIPVIQLGGRRLGDPLPPGTNLLPRVAWVL